MLDHLFPKSHAVCLRADGAIPDAFLARFLRDLVRKGETFIYLGPKEAVQPDGYWRLEVGRLRLWRVPLLVWGAEGVPDDPEFLFDAAWFGRHCLAAHDPAISPRILAELADYLRSRLRPRAFAWRTVNVLWAFAAPCPRETLEELLPLLREANFRAIVACSSVPACEFDEVVPLCEVERPPSIQTLETMSER